MPQRGWHTLKSVIQLWVKLFSGGGQLRTDSFIGVKQGYYKCLNYKCANLSNVKVCYLLKCLMSDFIAVSLLQTLLHFLQKKKTGLEWIYDCSSYISSACYILQNLQALICINKHRNIILWFSMTMFIVLQNLFNISNF